MTDDHPMPRPTEPVVVDIGPGYGALVVSAPEAMSGEEVEISLSSEPGSRRHVWILQRCTGRTTQFAAVFPKLRAGSYILWGYANRVIARPLITEGHVATIQWPVGQRSSRHLVATAPQNSSISSSAAQGG